MQLNCGFSKQLFDVINVNEAENKKITEVNPYHAQTCWTFYVSHFPQLLSNYIACREIPAISMEVHHSVDPDLLNSLRSGYTLF